MPSSRSGEHHAQTNARKRPSRASQLPAPKRPAAMLSPNHLLPAQDRHVGVTSPHDRRLVVASPAARGHVTVDQSPSGSDFRSAVVDTGGKGRVPSFAATYDPQVNTHTLILGTQPSSNSLDAGWYFGTNSNAFWHIVGDALGFRRGFHCGARTEAVPSILPHLLHAEEVYSEKAVHFPAS